MDNLTKVFFQQLSKMNDKDYIESFIEYYISLIKAKIKPSVTVTILKNDVTKINAWNNYGLDLLNSVSLKALTLRETDKALVLFIYDETLLSTYLKDLNHTIFLKNLGYTSLDNLDSSLLFLQERYNKYHCPHELGLFLGYPLNDVIDFIECDKNKCLLCGYWKVFNNKSEAIKTFEEFDNIRNYTITEILTKKAIVL